MNFTDLRDLFAFNSQPSTSTNALVRSIPILGQNFDVDSGTVPETVWNVGGVYDFPTTATVASIVSSSAQDTLATGTGAWYVLLEGLDSSYREQYESVAMNGLSTVTSANSYLRINSARVVYSGTNKANVGNITVTVNAKTVRYIEANESLDHTAVYTVPADHTLFIMSTSHSVLKATTTICTVVTKVYQPSVNSIFVTSPTIVGMGTPSSFLFHDRCYPRIPETSDYWFDVNYASTTNIEFSSTIRAMLVKDAFLPTYNYP